MPDLDNKPAVLGIRPTLFIGIGGTGDLVVRRIKRLVRENYGDDLQAFRYLVIDMADLADHDGLEPLEASEKCALNVFDSFNVVDNIENFKSIKDFWPDDPKNPGKPMNPKKLGAGTGVGQDRLTGRMAFFYYYANNPSGGKSIQVALQQAIASITQADLVNASGILKNGMNWGIIGNGAVQVIMVFSICGGTGGGMFLDTAFACRKLLARSGGHYIDSYCVMPSVIEQKFDKITPDERDNLYANACASLLDIEALNLGTDWKAEYAGETSTIRVPPFNRQFVFEYTQTQGVNPGSADNLFDNLAQSIFLSVGTSIYQNIDTVRGNEEEAMYKSKKDEKQRLFGSFGSASVIYPRNEIIDYCSSMLSKEFIQEKIIPDITRFNPEQKNTLEKNGKNQAGQFLQAQKITSTQLLGILLNGCTYDVADSAKLVDEAKEKQGHKSALAALNQLKDQDASIRSSQNLIIKKCAAGLIAEVSDAAQKKTIEILKTGGLQEAKEFLNALLRDLPEAPPKTIYSIPDSRDHLQSDSRKRNSNIDEKEKQRQQALRELDSRLLGSVLSSPQQRQVAVSKATDKFRDYYKAVLEFDANDAGISFYTLLEEDIKNNILMPLINLEAKIAVSEKLLENRSANALKRCRLNPANPFSRSCVSSEYAEQEYKNNKPNLGELNNLFWDQFKDTSWKEFSNKLTPEEISRQFIKTASSLFSRISEKTVLDIIATSPESSEGKSAIQHEFTALQVICHPYLRFKEGGVGQNPPRINSYVGVTNKNHLENLSSAIGIERARGYQGVVVGLSHRLDMLERMNCLASNNFSSWDTLEACYQRAIEDGKIVRLAPDEATETILNNERIFALSVAYGFITQKENSFFWNPDKLPVPPRSGSLGKGRVEAMAEFAKKHQNWVDGAELLIDNIIGSDGSEKSISFLDSWCSHLKDVMIKAGDKLKEQYQKELEFISSKRDEIDENKRTRDRVK
jgi:hypothetical protein